MDLTDYTGNCKNHKFIIYTLTSVVNTATYCKFYRRRFHEVKYVCDRLAQIDNGVTYSYSQKIGLVLGNLSESNHTTMDLTEMCTNEVNWQSIMLKKTGFSIKMLSLQF
jgi:hypothetical protein